MKDYRTRHLLLRSDSTGDLYPFHTSTITTPTALLSSNQSTWHQRLGHPDDDVLRFLALNKFISCNKTKSTSLCRACQLGKHVRHPFLHSTSIVENTFDIVHSDVWTSPIPNVSGFKYYILFLDHFSHFLWVYPLQKNSDAFNGTLSMYKARLVANGKSQQPGIDCDETFSPVVKHATIRIVLSLVVSHQWPIHQLDVKNAFLHGHLIETVYMHQPPGFTDPIHPDYVCHLQRFLYGLKQAPRAWFQRFVTYAVRVGFHHSKTDSSLLIFRKGADTAYLLLYVDDIILTASSSAFLQRIISSLHGEFAMTDLGPLNYFLGIVVTRTLDGIFLSQTKYATGILERAHVVNCNPCRTPVDTKKKLGPEGSLVADPTLLS
ncbi:ribonuclease H-like domain-containing protein [Tanacetum coccineum]